MHVRSLFVSEGNDLESDSGRYANCCIEGSHGKINIFLPQAEYSKQLHILANTIEVIWYLRPLL